MSTGTDSRPIHYIAAIGASAGGLEAIHDFFDNMAKAENLSFVIIQHLSPDYKSLLVELIGRHTPMEVFEAEHDMPVQRRCVYVIPNDKLMTIRHGRLRLQQKGVLKGPNTAIDIFMSALAEDFGDRAIGIILSGTGSDGTRGIAAVKECGGTVMVQDPLTAKFDGMPNSAINSGMADFILPPEMMPEELFKMVNERSKDPVLASAVNAETFKRLLFLVYQKTGFDFQHYKKQTILRRISKRMAELNVSDMEAYTSLLSSDEEEVQRLGNSFLIGVTRFFRDGAAFDALHRTVIPSIAQTKQSGDMLKVWVTACSTGEEAYSIAIVLDRYLQKQRKNLDVKIFASDIDEASLSFASKNLYPLSIADSIDKDILSAYFNQNGKFYEVIPRIRKQIVFARHNVVKDPPFINNDLVSCRNMLIYMSPVLQQKVLAKLSFSLNSRGYLLLGPSESALALKDHMREIDSKWKIFQKTGIQKPYPHEHSKTEDLKVQLSRRSAQHKKDEHEKGLDGALSELLFKEQGYAAFYIDNAFDIKEAIGAYHRYLSIPEKKLNLNLLKMVQRELTTPISSCVRKALKESKTLSLKSVTQSAKAAAKPVDITVQPAGIGGSPYTLVVLNEGGEPAPAIPQHHHHVLPPDDHADYILQLESELDDLQEQLRLAEENHESMNEELQSSNEELLSANEELQSSNEELQSLNEELHTLNTEHQLKIRELTDLNNDLDNYFRSTDIGQLFLDSALQIRKFNPAVTRFVNLIPSDIGRPLTHISTNFTEADLQDLIKRVEASGDWAEKELSLRGGETILIKIYPYLRHDRTIDGVVLTFVDITAITELNNIIKGVFNSSLSPIIAVRAVRNPAGLIADFELVSGNESASRILQTTGDGKKVFLKQHAPYLANEQLLKRYMEVVSSGRPLRTELQLQLEGHTEWFELTAAKMMDGLVITMTDMTDKKLAETKLKGNYNELLQTRETLRSLNANLEKMVEDRTRQLSESDERFRLVARATNDVIWDWNLATNEVWWNESFYTMFGHPNDTRSLSTNIWLENIHPEDRQRVEAKIFEAINDGEETWSDNYRFLKADGSYAYVFDRGHLLSDQFGVPYRMLGSMLDVTDLRLAEQRIKSSETKFQTAFESNMLGMIISDLSGNITNANDYFLKMLGYTTRELTEGSLRWDRLTAPEFLETSQQAVELLKRDGVCPPFEKEYVRKDGERVPVLIGSAAIKDGAELSAVTYIIDITDKKKAEAKEKLVQDIIIRNQEKLRFLADAVPQKIWTCLPDGRLDYFNKGWIDYTGKALEDFHTEGWQGLIHTEDWPGFEAAWEKALQTGEDFEIEQRLLCHDGRYRWHLTRSIAQRGSDGTITMWVGSSTDIHHQKSVTEEIRASEFYFRQLADKSPFMIWKVDEKGQCNYVNVQWIELTGLSFAESLGDGWQKALHDDDREREYARFSDCFKKRVSFHAKFRLNVANGGTRWVLAQSNPLINETFEGYIGSIMDITEQEQAQESLKVLMQKKDEFMSIASHELKTPIASMKASLQIVNRLTSKSCDHNPVITQFLDRANKQADKLSHLVTDLLDITKIQAGKIVFNKVNVDIGAILDECAEQVQAIEGTHRIEVRKHGDLTAIADRHRIEQVVVNFLSNAVKYSPQADRVILSAKGEGGRIRVEVQDFGIGIPRDKIPFLFSRFFRVQESSQKFSGLGLGLYISSEIISRHEGNIGVESGDGNGSVFWFEIPVEHST